MKRISLSAIILFATLIAQAQDGSYKNALGVRLGPSTPVIKSGLTYKHFIGNNAIEGILSFGDGIAVCGLYEIHKPIGGVENLQWFYGGGGYAGFQSKVSYIGAAGIVGFDYKFNQVPLNLSIDWKPELNIIQKVGFDATTVGFSARFTF